MFRPVPMVHLQVQVPTRDGPAVTRRIAGQGLLHLIDIGHGTASRASSATRELLAAFRDLARAVRQAARSIDVALPDLAGDVADADITDFAVEHAALREQFEPILRDVERRLRDAAAARDAAQQARDRLDAAARLEAAGIDLPRLQALRFACVRIGSAAAADVAALADALAPTAFAVVPLGPASPRQSVAVAVAASAREPLDAALRQTTFETLDTSMPAGAPAELQRALDAATLQEAEARRAIAALTETAGAALPAIARRADLGVVLLQAQTLFAAAGRFLVISGWIPAAQAPELTAAIARVTDGRAVVTVEQPDVLPSASIAALGVPILYRNPLLLRPFQRLVDLYGVPSYREIQPTAFFAISFVLMFGLMFGDVGHGAVLVAAGYGLFRYMPRFLDYGILLMEAGTASAAFGCLYGSVFGVEDWLPALWLRPLYDVTRFTRIAAGFGILMVSTGFVLGVVNAWRAGDRASAIVSVRGLFGAFAYWTCVAVIARMLLPVDWTVPQGAIVALLVGAVALLLLRPAIVKALAPANGAPRPREHAAPWWLGALEASVEVVDAIVAYFANTISFVRVAAFAAVHAAVMVAVFAMADTLARYRFGGWLSVAVLVAGNAVTILLEGLTVTVQALRLEYYEFFGKFFRGGGEPYRPLMLRPGGAQGER